LKQSDDREFRPFVRRLPEFKFWLQAQRSVLFAIMATFFDAFNVPVFWPILVLYFLILFGVSMKQRILVWADPPAFAEFALPCALFTAAAEDCPCAWARLNPLPLPLPLPPHDTHTNTRNLHPSLPAGNVTQHMVKYKYVPFSFGKTRYKGKEVRKRILFVLVSTACPRACLSTYLPVYLRACPPCLPAHCLLCLVAHPLLSHSPCSPTPVVQQDSGKVVST